MDERERLARIALVSRRFNQLQGLRLVVIGLAFAVPFAVYLALDARSKDALYYAFGGMFAIVVPGMLWADRFYRQAFGRVRQSGPDGAGLGLLMGIGFGVLIVLEMHFVSEHTMISVFAINVAFFLVSAIREWPWLRHHLFGAAACVVAILLQVKTENVANLPGAIAAGFVLLGVVSVPIGFLDHYLLATAMRPAEGTADAPTE